MGAKAHSATVRSSECNTHSDGHNCRSHGGTIILRRQQGEGQNGCRASWLLCKHFTKVMVPTVIRYCAFLACAWLTAFPFQPTVSKRAHRHQAIHSWNPTNYAAIRRELPVQSDRTLQFMVAMHRLLIFCHVAKFDDEVMLRIPRRTSFSEMQALC